MQRKHHEERVLRIVRWIESESESEHAIQHPAGAGRAVGYNYPNNKNSDIVEMMWSNWNGN